MLSRRSLVIAAVAALACAMPAAPAVADPGQARVVREIASKARTLDLRINSPALGTVDSVRLLLPPGWSKQANRTWPVLYLLHGGGDDYRAWTTKSDVAALTANAEAIIVMPNGGRCGNYSDWWNQGRFSSPAWETFHLTEVREILERDYRAGTTRAIAGLSMGGQGAMAYAARNPGMFRAAASYSGTLHMLLDRPSWPDGPDIIDWLWLNCPGVNPQNLWGDPDIPAQRAIWQQHNPYDLADRLRGTQLFVSSGNGELGPLGPPLDLAGILVEPVVSDMSVAFVNRLRSLNIPVTTDFYDGTHTWPYWHRELQRSLPMLLAAIGAG